MNKNIRVLAIMCSKHRPVMLRNAVLQMLKQSHAVDVAIYINSPYYPSDEKNYADLLDDLVDATQRKVLISYGASFDQHRNYLNALNLIDLDDYDLFLKIDDDDVYRLDYVNNIVTSFSQNGWDFSGEHALGLINGSNWSPGAELKNMGQSETEQCMGVPATWAFSRAAIECIIQLTNDHDSFEDGLWKAALEANANIITHHRNLGAQYHNNVHGENISTSAWLKQDVQPSIPALQLTSAQGFKLGLRLLKDSIPGLPGSVYRKIIGFIFKKR